jgi:hypothetical protein
VFTSETVDSFHWGKMQEGRKREKEVDGDGVVAMANRLARETTSWDGSALLRRDLPTVLFRNVIACVIDPQGLKGFNICRSRNKFW